MSLTRLLPLCLLACMTSLPGHAEDAPAPCAAEHKQWWDELSTPHHEQQSQEAAKVLKVCEDQAEATKKADFARTGSTWAAGLDPLPAGGWASLLVSNDGTFSIFGSHRHDSRKGSVVAVWLRTEYREMQTAPNGSKFRSAVERDLYDCDRIAQKEVSYTT
jgi:hypothetical protein